MEPKNIIKHSCVIASWAEEQKNGDHLVPVLICDQKPLINKRSSSLAILMYFSFFAVFLKLRKIDRCYLLLDPKVPVLYVLKASSLENNKVIFLQKVRFCSSSSFLVCK